MRNTNLGGWKIVSHDSANGAVDMNSELCKTPGVHRFFGQCKVTNFPHSTLPDSSMICTGSKFGFRIIIYYGNIYFQRLSWDGTPEDWYILNGNIVPAP